MARKRCVLCAVRFCVFTKKKHLRLQALFVHLIVDKTMEQSLAFMGVKLSSGEPLAVDKVQGQVKGFPE